LIPQTDSPELPGKRQDYPYYGITDSTDGCSQTVGLAAKGGKLSTTHPRSLERDSLFDFQPQQSGKCRAIVFLKNPGGTTTAIPGLGYTNGLVPINIGRMLTRVATIFLRNAQTAGKPFGPNEYVPAANLITVQSRTVREAVRLHNAFGSIPEVLPASFGGVWFAWGNERFLNSFRGKILSWYSGFTPPPPACFVASQGSMQSGILRVPRLGEKVKHPTMMMNHPIDMVLPSIL